MQETPTQYIMWFFLRVTTKGRASSSSSMGFPPMRSLPVREVVHRQCILKRAPLH